MFQLLLRTLRFLPFYSFLSHFMGSDPNVVYIMSGADSGNTITNDLFKLLFDILTDNKYHMVEASLNCIMD